ncbi:hypothetical protein HaLaN_09567, partial [Haematococcus lacustris]
MARRWLAPTKPHQHLAAASSAGTFLVANLKHITVALATWDAVWEVYLDPKWARQRLRLWEKPRTGRWSSSSSSWKDMEEVSMERHGRAKHLVVFFGAASIGTRATRSKCTEAEQAAELSKEYPGLGYKRLRDKPPKAQQQQAVVA